MRNELAFNGANFVARQVNWSMPGGWGQGVKSTEAWFRPVDTFAERFDGLLAEVAELGFAAYDLWCAQLDGEWSTPEHVDAARAAAERHGIRLTSYAGGPFGETAEECERVCALLEALEVPVLAGYCAFAEQDPRAFAGLLEKYGLRYGRENHPEASVAELLAKVEDIPGDRVGVTVDTGWFATQSCDPAAAIQPQPGAAGLEVTPGADPVAGPARQRGCRAGVEFIAIAGQQQAPAGMGLPGEGDDAHAAIVPGAGQDAFILQCSMGDRCACAGLSTLVGGGVDLKI